MAVSAKLHLRQTQSLTLAPQLLQAIKLLQFSNMELADFIEKELENNPLLERAEEREEDPKPSDVACDSSPWEEPEPSPLQKDMEENIETDFSHLLEGERIPASQEMQGHISDQESFTAVGANHAPLPENYTEFELYTKSEVTLREHLLQQLAFSTQDPIDRMLGQYLIDTMDDAGYMTESLGDIAERLHTQEERLLRVLRIIQTFEPTGVGARTLAECLELQLKEHQAFTLPMQLLLAHLPLLAHNELSALRKMCRLDQAGLEALIAQILRLNPKPGHTFKREVVPTLIPDVIATPLPDGSWGLEMNSEALPRVLVNKSYVTRVQKQTPNKQEKDFLSRCLQNANWLTRSLDQRAQTILKVACEIVRWQDGFFEKGVEYLRPLNLKVIAASLNMHESTISRVTCNKYISCPMGIFELKFFFKAPIASHHGGEAFSSESVKWKIKQLIDQEKANAVLADDEIVFELKKMDVEVARRTVAKYRESMRIPSSIQRRREKQMSA